MKNFTLNNNMEFDVKKIRDAKDNTCRIAIRSIVDENQSDYIFFTLSQVTRRNRGFVEYLENLGLSVEEKDEVQKKVADVIAEDCDTVINEMKKIKDVYEWLRNRIERNAAEGDDIVEKDGEVYIKKDTFEQIVKGIEQYDYNVKELLMQLETDGLLKSAKGRKDIQKRYGKETEWVFCIHKKREFENMDIQCRRKNETDTEGGED